MCICIVSATSYYLVNIPTPNTIFLDAADEKINYTEAFLQTHHSYIGPTTTPISNISSTAAQEHITLNIITESCATTTATATASAPDLISPSIIYTMAPEIPLSDSTEEPYNFLSTHPHDKTKEDHTSIIDYTPNESPRDEPSRFQETSLTVLPTEELTSIIASDPKVYSPREDTPRLPYLLQYELPAE